MGHGELAMHERAGMSANTSIIRQRELAIRNGGEANVPKLALISRDRPDRTTLLGMASVILLLHLVGWGVLSLLVVPKQLAVNQTQIFGLGLGLTAYILGIRHAFDADHIAAIDNTTRKLTTDNQRPLSVGFWFALGHSTIVFGMILLLTVAVKALADPVANENSHLQSTTGLIGSLASGAFLVLIGTINLITLKHILAIFRRMRTGDYNEGELQRTLDHRGLINRILRRLTRWIRKPTHMFPLGLLFGLGFDTVTEVSLLVLAGGVAAGSLPWYAILTLPVLFAAGMTLFDAINGWFMNLAYSWSFATPTRKVFYNLAITGLSVAVAFLIGGIQLTGLLAEQFDIMTGPLAWIADLDLAAVGYIIASTFLGTWLIAVAIWKFSRIERRWAPEKASVQQR